MKLYPIIKLSSGHLDYEYERELATLWFNENNITWERIEDSLGKGFYLVKRKNKENKVYICCTRDIANNNKPHFWFGLEHRYFRANPDMGIILICVWDNRVREYICLPNSIVRLFANFWFKKHDYYSIDISIVGNEYRMLYPKDYTTINEFVNAYRKLFEKIDLFE